MKKIASAPYLWIALAALFVWVGFSLFTGTKVERIDTSQGLQLLKGKTVEQALVVDGDQRVQLTLTEPFKVGDKDFGKTVEFLYVQPQGEDVIDAVVAANPPKGYNSDIATVSFFTSMISVLVPFLIIGVLFFFLMSRMQGGGSRVMGFGKSKAKLVGKEDEDAFGADLVDLARRVAREESGAYVAKLEGTIAERRPEYREYQRRTNAFFPWPSRRVRPRGGP